MDHKEQLNNFMDYLIYYKQKHNLTFLDIKLLIVESGILNTET